MRQWNSLVVDGSSVGTASFISSSVWSTDIIRASVQVVISSGTCNGTFILKGSNDVNRGLPPNQFTPTNWNIIGSTSQLTCSASSGQAFMIPAFEVAYEYMRIEFTAGNGGAALGLVQARMKGFAI